MEPFEKTYAMIKPDALRAGKAEEICQLIEVHGFTIIAKQKLQLTQQRAQEFYGEHKGKSFFETLVNFMTSGPVYALVLAKQNAIKEWRSLMGPTNSNTARAEKPKSLRALYGTDGTQNATHGSDSPASAAREIRFFFPQLSQEAVVDGVGQYMESVLQPVLVQGLTVLAKEKPCAHPIEALSFLGQWLLDNNPNKPRVVLPPGSSGKQ
ncbi:hypothetical protein WJX82_009787 [Trebouxia sp. C0006]